MKFFMLLLQDQAPGQICTRLVNDLAELAMNKQPVFRKHAVSGIGTGDNIDFATSALAESQYR